jgi:hypothetical protein
MYIGCSLNLRRRYMEMLRADDIDNRFTYHPPKSVEQEDAYDKIRTECRQLAHKLNKLCPDSREKSSAMARLDEVVMWANAAIARHEPDIPVEGGA